MAQLPSLPAGAALLRLPTAPAPVRAGTEMLFGSLAALRRSRPLHPDGLVYRATLRIDGRGRPLPEADLLTEGKQWKALVRFSRSVGLPQPVTDLLGLSIRVENAYGAGRHQDFLLISSGRRPGARHLLLPARSFFGGPFSSVLPYSIDGTLAVVGAVPATAPVRSAAETDMGDVAATADAGELRFRLAISAPWSRWHPVGELSIGGRVGGARARALRFNPWNTGGGIVPVGPFQGLRRPAYAGAQKGYSTT